MQHEASSPVDGTPSATLQRTVLVIVLGFVLALALNPGSAGRWGYMLDDSAAVRPLQVAAETASKTGSVPWHIAGLPVPYDLFRELSRRARPTIGAAD